MAKLIWMLDVAREMHFSDDHLLQIGQTASDSGFNSLGLYVEHRFRFLSAQWAAGKEALGKEQVQMLRRVFPGLQVIPFINLLGHMEGFLYSEQGREFRAEKFKGYQAVANSPEFQDFAERLLDDTLDAFDSDWVHIGGDETAQLASHPADKAVADAHPHGKARVYGEHFGRLAQRVIDQGRTPCIWGDMLLEHEAASAYIPPQTVVFDWQYKNGLADSSPKLLEQGFRVVGCPTLHVYNAAWLHVERSEQNIREVAQDSHSLNLEGQCLTTWEFGMMSALDTIFPAVQSAADIMRDPTEAHSLLDHYGTSRKWAEMMGVELERLGGIFAFSGIRSSLKTRLLMMRNPFLLWLHHHEELAGETGDQAIDLCNKALFEATNEAEQGVTVFIRSAVEFVQMAEVARTKYADGDSEGAVAALAPTRYLFDTLENIARRNNRRIGGSLADIERCRLAKERVEQAIRMIRAYGRGELGYLPAFEIITHPNFVPYDQGCWWLINSWARE